MNDETSTMERDMFTIGTTEDGNLVIAIYSRETKNTVCSTFSPGLARTYGAMLVALADQLENP